MLCLWGKCPGLISWPCCSSSRSQQTRRQRKRGPNFLHFGDTTSQPRHRHLERANNDWVSARIQLGPPLWLVAFWCQPPNETEVDENLCGTGVLIRNLKDRWQSLTDAPHEQLTFFASHFQNQCTRASQLFISE